MRESLKEIISDLSSDDRECSEFAALQLMFLLEFARYGSSHAVHGYRRVGDYYAEFVPEDLLQERLSDSDQKQVIKTITAELRSDPNRGNLVSALSKARADLVLPSLLEYVASFWRVLDSAARCGTAYLCITALQNMISPQPTKGDREEFVKQPYLNDLAAAVKAWCAAEDESTKEAAGMLKSWLVHYGVS